MLIYSPVLAHYDHDLPVDFSSYTLGTILSHVYSDHFERLVVFVYQVLSDSECKFPQNRKRRFSNNI